MANKTALAREVQARTGIIDAEAKLMVDTVIAAIGDALASGDEVSLSGFGKFYTSDIAGGGATPDHRRVVFRSFAHLRDRVNSRTDG